MDRTYWRIFFCKSNKCKSFGHLLKGSKMKSKIPLGSLIRKVAIYWIFWACFENVSVRFTFNTFTIFFSWIHFIHIWICLCYMLIIFAIFHNFFLPKRVFEYFFSTTLKIRSVLNIDPILKKNLVHIYLSFDSLSFNFDPPRRIQNYSEQTV